MANRPDLGGVAEVAGGYQYLSRVALGQGIQGFSPARAERQAMAALQQQFGQGRADAAAGAGEPDASHASRLFSQRMAWPSSGRCS
ncbi:hypothetical protein D9M68_938500 [compost metagenome]